jgi:hypothetical protein
MAIAKKNLEESYFSDVVNTFSGEAERKDKLRLMDANKNKILFIRRKEFEIPLDIAMFGGFSKEVNAFVSEKQRIENVEASRKIILLALESDPVVKKEAIGALFTMANSESTTIANMGLKGLGRIILQGDKNTKDTVFGMLTKLITMDYNKTFDRNTTDKKETLVIDEMEKTRSRFGALFSELLTKGDFELKIKIKDIITNALKDERSEVIRVGDEMIDAVSKSKKRAVKEIVEEINSIKTQIKPNIIPFIRTSD